MSTTVLWLIAGHLLQLPSTLETVHPYIRNQPYRANVVVKLTSSMTFMSGVPNVMMAITTYAFVATAKVLAAFTGLVSATQHGHGTNDRHRSVAIHPVTLYHML